jgi:hypothetical protein
MANSRGPFLGEGCKTEDNYRGIRQEVPFSNDIKVCIGFYSVFLSLPLTSNTL